MVLIALAAQVPMVRPVAAVEVGLVDGQLVVNPTKQQMQNSTLTLTLAGTKSGILMIEGAANFLPEELMVEALTMGHRAIGATPNPNLSHPPSLLPCSIVSLSHCLPRTIQGEICDAIEELTKIAGKAKLLSTLRKIPPTLVDSMDEVRRPTLSLPIESPPGNASHSCLAGD